MEASNLNILKKKKAQFDREVLLAPKEGIDDLFTVNDSRQFLFFAQKSVTGDSSMFEYEPRLVKQVLKDQLTEIFSTCPCLPKSSVWYNKYKCDGSKEELFKNIMSKPSFFEFFKVFGECESSSAPGLSGVSF